MKLRYHLENKNDGILVYETEPQIRSLFIYSQTKNIIRVPLPYIYFTIRYVKSFDPDSFVYQGIYGLGLNVVCNFKSINSFEDEVFYLPTDAGFFQGFVCTNHNYDNKTFNTLLELVNFVITLWWSSTHEIAYCPFFNTTIWSKTKLNELKDGQWKLKANFKESISRIPKTFIPYYSIELPENPEFIKEPSLLILDW